MIEHLRALDNSNWLCEPVQLQKAVARVLRIPTCPTAREVAEFRRIRLEEARASATKAIRSVKGRVGVIPVVGPLQQRMSSELMKAGGTSTEEIGVALDAMLAEKSIEAIVLHIDSPGGEVFGIEELSDKIFAARGQKKIYALSDSMACSAAYWIGTAAEQLLCTPGGVVGSVGVYCMHVDQSKALEAEGVKVSFVHAGKYKVEGNPFEPLQGEALQNWQALVDEIYGKFVGALKRNRGLPASQIQRDFGEGRVVTADTALERKMIDRVMTFDELLGKLTGRSPSDGQASAEVLRLRQDQRKRETA